MLKNLKIEIYLPVIVIELKMIRRRKKNVTNKERITYEKSVIF
jgi:hypothetical protein